MRRRTWLVAAAAFMALAPAGIAVRPAMAGDEGGPIFSGRDDGVAIKGADPVAYHTQGKAVQGVPEHSTTWSGRTWHFASAENRERFEADPARYAPRYGGFCAYAAAQGQKVKIEPEAWSIVDGRLYLNYDLNVRDRWDANQAEYIAAADRRWPKIAAE